MQPFTKKVIEIISSIPAGYVMTYGQIAKLAGSARGARQVVRILHSMSESYNLPWHRVVNAKGEIAIKDDESRFKQTLYLSDEGAIPDENGIIDLNKYRYRPDDVDLQDEEF
ncbi:MGMT family protein [Paenibacillus pini]|uniref:Methyltransferase n=1 Tax=Paenibacillus pini JCM 16418 TaxID=1236976 RepID=W7YIP8_9BACL|nr:MGMT family protein [Paenibacillus pini]GAF08332.1 methyltransferase [Paenibacillus pini JCM 16418]